MLLFSIGTTGNLLLPHPVSTSPTAEISGQDVVEKCGLGKVKKDAEGKGEDLKMFIVSPHPSLLAPHPIMTNNRMTSCFKPF